MHVEVHMLIRLQSALASGMSTNFLQTRMGQERAYETSRLSGEHLSISDLCNHAWPDSVVFVQATCASLQYSHAESGMDQLTWLLLPLGPPSALQS